MCWHRLHILQFIHMIQYIYFCITFLYFCCTCVYHCLISLSPLILLLFSLLTDLLFPGTGVHGLSLHLPVLLLHPLSCPTPTRHPKVQGPLSQSRYEGLSSKCSKQEGHQPPLGALPTTTTPLRDSGGKESPHQWRRCHTVWRPLHLCKLHSSQPRALPAHASRPGHPEHGEERCL